LKAWGSKPGWIPESEARKALRTISAADTAQPAVLPEASNCVHLQQTTVSALCAALQ
ncbi:hypothetical protein MMC07_000407, partial [Pseudocyphellaria aurata]|nr:hypothetical protein [Pseudocyphellaria aurata]